MIAVNVCLWEPVPPLERGERYEDPVFAALADTGLGRPGGGAGSLVSREGEILQADFDVELTDLRGLDVIVRVLEANGAPRETRLTWTADGVEQVRSCGGCEGLALYLNGVELPDEVYTAHTSDELLDALLADLDDAGEFRGSWQGPRETALYLYGASAERMFARLEPRLRAHPLCQRSRVVIRHGHPDLRPRVVRIDP